MLDAINISILYGVHSYTFLRRNVCTSVLSSCTMHDTIGLIRFIVIGFPQESFLKLLMLDTINISILYGVHSHTFLRRNMCTSVLISCTMHDSNRSDKIHSNRIPTGELLKLLMLDTINISILYGVHSYTFLRRNVCTSVLSLTPCMIVIGFILIGIIPTGELI